MNEILAEAIREIKIPRTLERCSPKQKDRHEDLSTPSMEDGAKQSNTSQTTFSVHMKDVILSCQDTVGIAMVDENLMILDCNPLFAAILLGQELTQAQDRMDRIWHDPSLVKGSVMQKHIHSPEEHTSLLRAMQHINSSDAGT
jgi:hypothetical protein